MRRLTVLALGVAALLAPVHALRAQATLGPVTLGVGLGGSWQAHNEFSPVGAHLWLGAETVLDQRVRVRLDLGVHRFGYASPRTAPCPPTTWCAPPVTSPLAVTAITGTIVWRDTTGVRRWYYYAGLGAYSALGIRDYNSRLGLTGGIGREFGLARDYFIEARVHVPYDAYGYGAFVPVTFGWNFGHFTP